MDIEWEEPPREVLESQGRHPGRYLEFALALREHPGRWAVLPGGARTEKSSKGTAQNIRRGQVKGFTRGDYEAVAQGPKVWVRYQPKDRPAGGEPSTEEDESATSTPVRAVPTTPAAKVRAWAKDHGIEVPDRGRLPEEVWERYAAAINAGETGLPVRAVRMIRHVEDDAG